MDVKVELFKKVDELGGDYYVIILVNIDNKIYVMVDVYKKK